MASRVCSCSSESDSRSACRRAGLDGDDAERGVLAAQAADELADVLLGVLEPPNGIVDGDVRAERAHAAAAATRP